MVSVYSWNVNGIRAACRKGFLAWLKKEQPDILCVQESKARPSQLDPSILSPDGYRSVWQPAERKGYSGVATYFRKEPLSVDVLGVDEFDAEGRVQIMEFNGFTVINAYFPNSQPERARLDYKLAFCDAMRERCIKLRHAGKHVILCGDYNIAHQEIDLARPKENEDNPGYYPEERAAMGRFIKAGFVDTFRHFTKEPGHYTWWSYRARARENNIGWRIDYHCVNKEFLSRVRSSAVHPDIMGSDHCPLSVTIK